MLRPPLAWLLAAVLSLALSGCDAWPTTVANRSSETITFRWRQKDHAEWSAWRTVGSGQSVTLARAHYVEDFTGVEVEVRGRTYSPTQEQLATFHRACARSVVDHITTLGDCEITYSGQGKFSVRRLP